MTSRKSYLKLGSQSDLWPEIGKVKIKQYGSTVEPQKSSGPRSPLTSEAIVVKVSFPSHTSSSKKNITGHFQTITKWVGFRLGNSFTDLKDARGYIMDYRGSSILGTTFLLCWERGTSCCVLGFGH